MVNVSWEEHLERLKPAAAAFMTTYREFCLGLPDVIEDVHRTEVKYSAGRFFVSGSMISNRLELMVHLLEEHPHPRLVGTIPVNKQVIGHRFSLPTPADFDESITDLIWLAHDQVGYGLPGRDR